VSDDHQWRQLGSIVNAVLMDARTKAIRKGALSKAPEPAMQSSDRQNASETARERLGNGFLAGDAQSVAKPIQLELPFGIAPAPQPVLEPRAPRGARLM
jgi:hypothetical protein